MKTLESTVDKLMESEVISSHGLSREDVMRLIDDYQEAVISTMIDNGYTKMTKDIKMYLVKLKNRRYVLRGNSYNNARKYKFRLYVDLPIYKRVEDSFNLLGEDY